MSESNKDTREEYLKHKRNRCRNHDADSINALKEKSKMCHYCSIRNKEGEVDNFKKYESIEERFKIEDKSYCETCREFNSLYIEYPISIDKINYIGWNEAWEKCKIESKNKECGELVKVKPCSEEYGGKTYLGILLGQIPYSPSISHDNTTNILDVYAHTNPCIFIPETKSIVWGMGSFWTKIESIEDFKEITNEDIGNVWYVQLLKNSFIENKND